MTRRIILVDIGAGLTLRGVLPSVALFADYTASLVASGGQAPYSYSLAAGALPDGLALDAATGIISGTAGVAGQSVFTVRVTDLSGAHVDRQFAITVIAEPLSLSGSAPAWTVGTAYSYTYSAAHGVPPYTWSLAAGALPAGLALNAATGEISGTPTAGNAPTWTVRVTDSAGASIDLRDNATLQLLGDFADATVGTAYSSDLLINGGDMPYTNPRVTVGALPAGMALSIVGDKLRLSGTPTAAATSSFTAAVDSADEQTATSEQSIAVDAADADPYWNKVISLLHFDGSNGSTAFTDVKGLVWQSGSNTTIDNSVTLIAAGAGKLGGLIGGNVSYLRTPKSGIVFADHDFCIDVTVNLLSMPGSGQIGAIFSNGDISGPDYYGLRWYINPDGSVGAYVSSSGTSVTLLLTSAAGVVAVGARRRLRLSRRGTSFKMFSEGNVIASGTMAGNIYSPAKDTDAYIGRALDRGSTPETQGWLVSRIDEWRVTIGTARDDAAYVPSDLPFPNA